MFSISLSHDQFTSFTFTVSTEFFVIVLIELQGKDLFGKFFNPGICPCGPLLL